MFEYPGTNLKNLASYLRGDYPGWSPNFLPHLDINDWQRKVGRLFVKIDRVATLTFLICLGTKF